MDAEIAYGVRVIADLSRRIDSLDKIIKNQKLNLLELNKQPRDWNNNNERRRTQADIDLSKEEMYEIAEKLEKRRAQVRFTRFFSRLPPELKLHIMYHMPLPDLDDLMSRSMSAANFFLSNKTTVFRGMEDQQFRGLKWLFGDSLDRTQEQKQVLKDCVFLTVTVGEKSDGEMVEIFQMVNEGSLTGRVNIEVLRSIANAIDEVMNRFSVSRRTALCLLMFRVDRIFVIAQGKATLGPNKFEGNPFDPYEEYGFLRQPLPMKERISLYGNQPAAIQSQIRNMLEMEVVSIINFFDTRSEVAYPGLAHPLMGKGTAYWIALYFSPKKVGAKMEPDQMGPWLANLLIGYILNCLLPNILLDCASIADLLERQNVRFCHALMMELDNTGATDLLWQEDREFAKVIGFDIFLILKGTLAEVFLKKIWGLSKEEVEPLSLRIHRKN